MDSRASKMSREALINTIPMLCLSIAGTGISKMDTEFMSWHNHNFDMQHHQY